MEVAYKGDPRQADPLGYKLVARLLLIAIKAFSRAKPVNKNEKKN